MRRRIALLASGALVAALAFLTVFVVNPAEAGSRPAAATPAPATTDDSLLRELAERLLTQPYGPPGQPLPTTELLPGAQPADAPLALPTPPRGRLVGSVARRVGGKLFVSETIFDAPGDPGDVGAAYEVALRQVGWSPAQINDKGGPQYGFQPTTVITNRYFCPPAGTNAFLYLFLIPATADKPNDLRFRLDLSGPGPCAARPSEPTRPTLPPGLDRLPALVAPEGAQVQPGGGGGGQNRFSSGAIATTTLSVAELEAFYARQLEAAGWTRAAGRADGPLAWSTWKIPGDGDFEGFLYVLLSPGGKARDLYVHVASPAPFGPYGPGGAVPSGPMPTSAPVPAGTPIPPQGQPVLPTRTTMTPTGP